MKSDLFPDLPQKTYIMGIINLTPDSFSGDGLFNQAEVEAAALAQAIRFVEEGADLLDIGAESTRPGSRKLDASEELGRMLPALRLIRKELPDTLISVDTYKAETARACLGIGADIVNEVWGFQYDPHIAGVVAEFDATAVLMHNRESGARPVNSDLGGRYEDVEYEDIVSEVGNWLAASLEIAHAAGVSDDKIILDPGIGFGKTINQNLYLLKHLDALLGLGYPILLGVSRKGFIGHTLNLPQGERLEGSLAANAWGVMKGASILRVHDVKETVRLARTLDAIRNAEL
ncbi:MAG: dihydropteroate synthase [Anaerolineaceae bacterium]|jgi:dihydropteroate synthase|nr:dihydropteroate synthase [Anaerolineaceae bacterium]MDD4043560.1 dihydropteroate synthase [Anaerolineaceae bacterium]MDD4577611.1 dihydropteroate synthase [Anaerolineaceae bacterium]